MKFIKNILIIVQALLFISFVFSMPLNAQVNPAQEKVYIKIEIKGLACPYCAFGMEKELKKVAGVDDVDIELKKGLAYISTPLDQKPDKEKLEKIITDAGFTAGTIEYGSVPFLKEKKKKE